MSQRSSQPTISIPLSITVPIQSAEKSLPRLPLLPPAPPTDPAVHSLVQSTGASASAIPTLSNPRPTPAAQAPATTPPSTARPRPASFSNASRGKPGSHYAPNGLNRAGGPAHSAPHSHKPGHRNTNIPVQMPASQGSVPRDPIQFGAASEIPPSMSPPSVSEDLTAKSGGELPDLVGTPPSVPRFGAFGSTPNDRKPSIGAGRSPALRAHDTKGPKHYATDNNRGRSASHSNYPNAFGHPPPYPGHGPPHYPRSKGDKGGAHGMGHMHPADMSPVTHPYQPQGPMAPPIPVSFAGHGGHTMHGPPTSHPAMHHPPGPMPGAHPSHQPYYASYGMPSHQQQGSPSGFGYRGNFHPGQRPPHPGVHTKPGGGPPTGYQPPMPAPTPSSAATPPGRPHGVPPMSQPYLSPAHAPSMPHPHVSHPHTGSPHMRPRDKPAGPTPGTPTPPVVTASSSAGSLSMGSTQSPIAGSQPAAMMGGHTAVAQHPWGPPQYYSQMPGQYDPAMNAASYYRPPAGNMYPYPPQFPAAGSPMAPQAASSSMASRLNTSAPAFSPQPKASRAIRIVHPDTKKEVDLKNPPPPQLALSKSDDAAGKSTTPEVSEAEKPTFVPPTPRPVTITAPPEKQTSSTEPAADATVPEPEASHVASQPAASISNESVAPPAAQLDAAVPPTEPMELEDGEIASPASPAIVPATGEAEGDDGVKSSDSEPETISINAKDLAELNRDQPEASPVTPTTTAPTTEVPELERAMSALSVNGSASETPSTSQPTPVSSVQSSQMTSPVPVASAGTPLSRSQSGISLSKESPAHPTMVLDATLLDQVQYPPDMPTPRAEKGVLKYSRDFLLKFQPLCQKRPLNLRSEVIAVDEGHGGRDDGRRSANSGRRGPASGRGSNKTAAGGFFDQGGMGNFATPLRTSEERFAASTAQRGVPGNFAPGFTGPIGAGMNIGPRSTSHASRMGNRESRGSRRGDKKKHHHPTYAPGHGMGEPIKPLVKSENRWKPMSLTDKNQTTEEIPSDEVISRKVKGLLNKLTLEKFDSIFKQILDFALLAAKQGTGHILELVIQLIFEKAIDEPNFSSVYALLCREMTNRVDTVKDETKTDSKGNPLSGVMLFRRYLLSRCQYEFERGWRLETTEEDITKGVVQMMSDEYYEVQKKKRHGLGLIAFIGELYKMGMLTDKIVHSCIVKLLGNTEDPVEEEVESLCKLFFTCGKRIAESESLGKNLDAYFLKVKELAENKKLGSRFRCLLMDVVDLRKRNWQGRSKNTGPKTIAEIHQDAERQKEEMAMQLRKSASSTGRGMPNLHQQMGGGRRGDRASRTLGGAGQDFASASAMRKVGDLSRFGNMNKAKNTSTASLGPGGALMSGLMGGSRGWKDEGAQRGNTTSGGSTPQLSRSNSNVGSANKFNALMGVDDPAHDKKLAPVQKSVSARPKLNLLARGATAGDKLLSPATAEPAPTEGGAAAGGQSSLSSAPQVGKEVRSALLEYASSQDYTELKTCIQEASGSDAEQFLVLSAGFQSALEKGDKLINLMFELIPRLVADNTLARAQMLDGLVVLAKEYEDTVMDYPKLGHHLAQWLLKLNATPAEVVQVLAPLENPSSILPQALDILKPWLEAQVAMPEQDVGSVRDQLQLANMDVKRYFADDSRDSATVSRALSMKDLSDFFPNV
ncbi:hypothetical protein H4R34_000273 [Dimargaris verticillata]|uniref:MI domain-containing protein n=1 Tax=Dimargaris verticillata TaxID=2761393 RepID=A0A9W8EC06_9FUNG|nr:hypothetical protein H4R34_000273 [Dimargaris verticillata]